MLLIKWALVFLFSVAIEDGWFANNQAMGETDGPKSYYYVCTFGCEAE